MTVKLTLLDCLLDEGITAEAAHLPGLSLRRCLLTHPSKPVLYADELRTVGGVCFEGSTILGATADGAVRMIGARIGGQLDCSGATVRNPSGPALIADALHVDGETFLNECFTADGVGEQGAVRLRGARIGGALDCSGATIRNPSGPALIAERLQVDGKVGLSAGFTAEGAVQLSGAHIGDQLDCTGAIIGNDSGPALHAEHIQVEGGVFLREGFTADGAGGRGAVCLHGAHISAQLDCTGAVIRNASGPALHAERIQVEGSVFLRKGFSAHGAGELGAVRLVGAHISGQLSFSAGATIRNPSGPALHAERIQVEGNVFLPKGFTSAGDGPDGAVRLVGARVGGQFDCSNAVVESRSDPKHRWHLDGLTYTGLPLDPLSKGRAGWLELFRTATPAYAAQPYQQLASVYRAAGHDGDVRQTLIAQRRAQLDRGMLTGRERLWARVTGITLGYGYQPWRALLFLVGVVVTSVVLAVILGAHGALAHPLDPKNPTAATTPCTITEQVGVGLDVGTPFLNTRTRDRCTATNTATGSGLTYSTWGLQLLAGALAALFIAGFTGIVRKT